MKLRNPILGNLRLSIYSSRSIVWRNLTVESLTGSVPSFFLVRIRPLNFDFSDDDKMVQDQVNRFLRDKCGFGEFRSVLEGDATYSESVWRGLSEMGLQGTAIPSAYGGVEAGYLSLCLAARELGAHLAPVPFSSSIYLAARQRLRYPASTPP